MKNLKILFLLVIPGIMSISCSDDGDDDGSMTEQLSTKIEKNLQNSTWKITKFIDSGKDETNDFAGYNFEFNSSGVLSTSNGINSYDGTWSIDAGDSSDDSPDDLHFNIYFNLTNDFEDLNDDWDIVSQTPNKLELIDVSGGNGGTDNLIFEKS